MRRRKKERSLFDIFGLNYWERPILYRETEDKDEKTVDRSPEPSGGNGGELDLLIGWKKKFRETFEKIAHQIYGLSFQVVTQVWHLVKGEGMGDIEAGVPETAQKLSVGIQFVYEYVFLCFVQNAGVTNNKF